MQNAPSRRLTMNATKIALIGSSALAAFSLGACGKITSPDSADRDTGPEGAMSCPGEVQAALLLANPSVALLEPSPDGRFVAGLVDYDWLSGWGNLVVFDLSSGTSSGIVATGVTGPLVFTAEGADLLFPDSVSAVWGDGYLTWGLSTWSAIDGSVRSIASNVVDIVLSPFSSSVLVYRTPDGTFAYDFTGRSVQTLGTGRTPCLFESDSGFTCLPVYFTEDHGLFWADDLVAGGLSTGGAITGTLRHSDANAPSAASILAESVTGFRPSADGSAVLVARDPTFDDSPECGGCPRGDLVVVATDGSFSRTLLAQARYASPAEDAALSPDGALVAFQDPDRNPTTVTLLSLSDGAQRWAEEGCQPEPPAIVSGSVLVWKDIWTGTEVDRGADAISSSTATARVRLGEQLRAWMADTVDPGEARVLAVAEYPDVATGYEGSVRVRLWDLGDGLPSERPASELDSSPAFNASSFDQDGENLLMLTEYHDDWRGRLVAALAPDSALRDVSRTDRAHDGAWIGEWVAFLEDTEDGTSAPVAFSRVPFEADPIQLGHSVHLVAGVPGECPRAVFADCAGPLIDEAACAHAAPGIYLAALGSGP
ncbi:MAG: hypothetical protein ABIO70_24950 [Pseudomonadota bacterium]